jgi:hypothetical protein
VTCENLAGQLGGRLVRINVREPDVRAGHVSLPVAALDALRALDTRLSLLSG